MATAAVSQRLPLKELPNAQNLSNQGVRVGEKVVDSLQKLTQAQVQNSSETSFIHTTEFKEFVSKNNLNLDKVLAYTESTQYKDDLRSYVDSLAFKTDEAFDVLNINTSAQGTIEPKLHALKILIKEKADLKQPPEPMSLQPSVQPASPSKPKKSTLNILAESIFKNRQTYLKTSKATDSIFHNLLTKESLEDLKDALKSYLQTDYKKHLDTFIKSQLQKQGKTYTEQDFQKTLNTFDVSHPAHQTKPATLLLLQLMKSHQAEVKVKAPVILKQATPQELVDLNDDVEVSPKVKAKVKKLNWFEKQDLKRSLAALDKSFKNKYFQSNFSVTEFIKNDAQVRMAYSRSIKKGDEKTVNLLLKAGATVTTADIKKAVFYTQLTEKGEDISERTYQEQLKEHNNHKLALMIGGGVGMVLGVIGAFVTLGLSLVGTAIGIGMLVAGDRLVEPKKSEEKVFEVDKILLKKQKRLYHKLFRNLDATQLLAFQKEVITSRKNEADDRAIPRHQNPIAHELLLNCPKGESTSDLKTSLSVMNSKFPVLSARDHEGKTVLHKTIDAYDEAESGDRTIVRHKKMAHHLIRSLDKSALNAKSKVKTKSYESGDVEYRFERRSALHESIYKGTDKMTRLLIQNPDVDLTLGNETDSQAIHLAVDAHNHKALDLLLSKSAKKRGVDANATNKGGFTPIQVACLENNPKALKKLLKHVDVKQALTHKNKFKEDALDIAIRKGDLECSKVLLDAAKKIGLEPSYKLIVNSMRKKTEDVTALLLRYCKREDAFNQTDEKGYTLLHWATLEQDYKAVKYLLKKDKKQQLFAAKATKKGNTALHMAAHKKDPNILAQLLKHLDAQNLLTKNVSVGLKDETQTGAQSPLEISISRNDYASVKLMIKALTKQKIDYKSTITGPIHDQEMKVLLGLDSAEATAAEGDHRIYDIRRPLLQHGEKAGA